MFKSFLHATLLVQHFKTEIFKLLTYKAQKCIHGEVITINGIKRVKVTEKKFEFH